MIAKVWDYEIKDFREIDAIGILRYVGETFFSLINGKEYVVVENDGGLFRIIDESEQDYLYEIDNPRPMTGYSPGGKWEIILDETGELAEILK